MKKIIKKTSREWQELKPDFIVLDADGWDRSNFEYSWNEELITEEEYNKRLLYSTSIFYGKRVNNNLDSSNELKS